MFDPITATQAQLLSWAGKLTKIYERLIDTGFELASMNRNDPDLPKIEDRLTKVLTQLNIIELPLKH